MPEKPSSLKLPDPDWTVAPDEGRALLDAFLRVHDVRLRAEIIAHIRKIAASGGMRD